MNDWTELARNALQHLMDQSAALLPRLLVSFLLVAIGAGIAYLVMIVLRGLLQRAGLDRVVDRTGLGSLLARSGYENPASHLVAFASFWVILAVFLVSSADAVGLPQVSQTLTGLLALLPPVALAVLVLLVGLSMARTARRTVEGVAERSRLAGARPLGAGVFYLITALTLVIALSGLGVDFTIVTAVVTVILASLGTGFAVTLGLGSRDVARNTITGIYVRREVRVGDRVKFEALEGRVAAVGQVSVTLEHEGRRWLVPYDRFLAGPVEILEKAGSPTAR